VDRPAIDHHAKIPAVLCIDPCTLVEPTLQLPPHAATRSLGRVERLAGEYVLEQVAHGVNMVGCG
jgi:hypothetical protein